MFTRPQGVIVIRAGERKKYREIPVHRELCEHLAIWINDERPGWPGVDTNPALLLNRCGGRLSARGAHDILLDIADQAGVGDDFTGHVLRHTFAPGHQAQPYPSIPRRRPPPLTLVRRR